MPEQRSAHNRYQEKALQRGGFGGRIGRNAVDPVGMLQKFMGFPANQLKYGSHI